MSTIYQIGIRFPDNDFGNTVRAFLDGLKEWDALDKPTIVELFKRSAPGLYWLYQNRMGYGLNWKPECYLFIQEKDVFLGKEVEEYLKNNSSNCNGDFHVLYRFQYAPAYITTY
jgi:hypothetical protein